MKFILENQLLDKNEIAEFIPEMFLTTINGDQVKCDYVGYIRVKDKEPVTILPKVFCLEFIKELNNGNKDAHKWLEDYIITQYLSLKKYSTHKRHKGLLPEDIKQSNEVTYIDVALAVINFYSKHRYLKNVEKLKNRSKSASKVKWNHMINRNNYIIIDDELFFDEFEEDKLGLTSNDFLLKLLNTEVRNICKTLGLTSFDKNDEILDPKEYKIFLKKPLKNLKVLKKKYFRDEYIKLIKVLYNYYYISEASYGKNKCDFLLTNNFELVFEDMVDEFLSTPELVQAYKYNKDGKIIDHVFSYNDLIISKRDTIYIGDSKYYSDISLIKSTRWKQYTYVKNLQSFILTENTPLNLKYRENLIDPIFYGYNIVPNFFISPYVNKLPYKHLKDFFFFIKSEAPLETYQLPNRLFDRDTLYIYYFGVDLIFLMHGYIKGFDKEHTKFAINIIRDSILNYLNECYIFYKIHDLSKEVLSLLKEYYYLLHGKILYNKYDEIIIIALKNSEEFKNENSEIVDFLINSKIKFNISQLA
ncbi:hypothetical protein NSA27_06790 [Clostridium tepidum]|jgi:hypothetical protein|uniref:hypothetical protein n=1 Tax=Clostridium tepidum TaxID=1962263 RepID=UPI002149C868|nr:hypothetical protein [Clostridium tepidum]MCR1934399.1 hypothetical protein [Clostridium tepidum]